MTPSAAMISQAHPLAYGSQAKAVTQIEAPHGDELKAAREFAGLFYTMMLDEMQKTVPESPYQAGRGEEVFRSLWTSEVGRRMGARQGDALAEAVLLSMNNKVRADEEAALEGGQG